MKTESRLTIVTGAPGTGKTTTVTQFLKIRSDVIVLDIDWLAESAGKLAEKDIYSDASTWKPYGELWFEFLHSIYRNSKQAIFFTPNTPSDIESVGKPFWCDHIDWILLDCADDILSKRLNERVDWSLERKEEALNDARELRTLNISTIDTGITPPKAVVESVMKFVEECGSGS